MTATATGTYATKADLKVRLSITDTTDDTLLQSICDWANAGIESFTKRVLAPITYTAALFDGYDAVENGRCLMIPRGIRTISSLQVAPNTGGTFTTVASGDYFIQPNDQERDPGWPGTELWLSDIPSGATSLPIFLPGFSNIRITGTGGWAAQPDDVIDVALNVAVAKWRGRSAIGGDTFSTGTDGERTFTRYLSYEDKATLSRYMLRQPVVI